MSSSNATDNSTTGTGRGAGSLSIRAAMLIIESMPYSKHGVLACAYRKHYGQLQLQCSRGSEDA